MRYVQLCSSTVNLMNQGEWADMTESLLEHLTLGTVAMLGASAGFMYVTRRFDCGPPLMWSCCSVIFLNTSNYTLNDFHLPTRPCFSFRHGCQGTCTCN